MKSSSILVGYWILEITFELPMMAVKWQRLYLARGAGNNLEGNEFLGVVTPKVSSDLMSES